MREPGSRRLSRAMWAMAAVVTIPTLVLVALAMRRSTGASGALALPGAVMVAGALVAQAVAGRLTSSDGSVPARAEVLDAAGTGLAALALGCFVVALLRTTDRSQRSNLPTQRDRIG